MENTQEENVDNINLKNILEFKKKQIRLLYMDKRKNPQ